jgi:5-(carboxyamino)imidazole ribonucleotide synthase
MLNLIGEMPDSARLLSVSGAHLHDYGKQARPGRKLGHCTIVADTAAGRDTGLRKITSLLAG